MRFSSTEDDSDTKLGVLATGIGSTLEIGAATELITVVDVGDSGPLDEVALDGTGKLKLIDTSTLENDVSKFESPAVIGGRGFKFGVIGTVNDGP